MCVAVSCIFVELGEVGELHQQMDQQAEELLRDTKLLKTELMGKLYLCVYLLMNVLVCNVSPASNITFRPLIAQLHKSNSLKSLLNPKNRSAECNI